MALIAEEFGERVGFMTFLIGWDDKDAALRITNDANAPFITVGIEQEQFLPVIDLFASGFIPEMLLIDENGNIVESIVGGSNDDYRAAIENALSH